MKLAPKMNRMRKIKLRVFNDDIIESHLPISSLFWSMFGPNYKGGPSKVLGNVPTLDC